MRQPNYDHQREKLTRFVTVPVTETQWREWRAAYGRRLLDQIRDATDAAARSRLAAMAKEMKEWVAG